MKHTVDGTSHTMEFLLKTDNYKIKICPYPMWYRVQTRTFHNINLLTYIFI